MSSHSGTIGRSNGRSVSGNGSHMRRQRSVEWQHAHGYSSSDEDERGIHGTINPSFDSQLLAQLIAQSQELSNKCEYITFQLHWILTHTQFDCYFLTKRLLILIVPSHFNEFSYSSDELNVCIGFAVDFVATAYLYFSLLFSFLCFSK